MAVDLQLRAAFERSIRDVDGSREAGGDPSHKVLLAEKGKRGLQVAYRLLLRARSQSNVPGGGRELRAPELLVLAAEAAVKNGEFDTAREACHEYFLDGGSMDQFFCRALFAKALVVDNSIRRDGLVGAEATRRRSRAVGFLLQALDFAVKGGSRYGFLVYNATVHAWNVIRPALKAGRAGHHATEISKFVDALEAADDPDLHWRYTLLSAVSLALRDAGDAPGAFTRAAFAYQHAEAFVVREGDAAEVARVLLNQAKERVTAAQVSIRKIEEATAGHDSSIAGDEENDGGEDSTIVSGDVDSNADFSSLDSKEKLAAALSEAVSNRAAAEAEVVEATRTLEPLMKRATKAAAILETAWLLRAHAATDAAVGGAEAKKITEVSQTQATGDRRKAALLVQQQVLAGAVAGDAILPALNTIAQAADTVVVRLAETLLRAASNDGEGGDGEGGTRGRLDADQNELREDGVLDVSAFPAPSIEEQSVLVDLGRTAFKAVRPEIEAASDAGTSRSALLCFAKACHLRASSSARRSNNRPDDVRQSKETSVEKASSTGTGDHGTTVSVSVAAFRAKLELLGAELAAQGMFPESSPPATKVGGASKLDARRTDAVRLANRVEALKRVERFLLNGKRLGDPELLQEGCCLAFTVGLPLLSTRNRKHVHRCFSLAAGILQELESPLSKLRAQLHFEVAKCEMDSDFLAKAASHVEKALAQDYGESDMSTLTPETPLDGVWDHEPGRDFSEGNSTPEVGHDGGDSPGVVAARADALNDTLRPIDRFMAPLAEFLRIKTSVDVEPNGAEDKALMLVDQAKEAANPSLRRTLLAQAADQLEVAAQANSPKDAGTRVGADGDEAVVGHRAADEDLAEGGSDETTHKPKPVQRFDTASAEAIDDTAIVYTSPESDGSKEDEAVAAAEGRPPSASEKRIARLWFAVLELTWGKESGGRWSGSRERKSVGQDSSSVAACKKRPVSPSHEGDGRDIGLTRKAALAVLQSGPWHPDKNRELLVLQTRAQFILGETYIEELRLVDLQDDKGGDASVQEAGSERLNLDPRTMGIPTAACGVGVTANVAGMLDQLKCRACGCFVAGMRRGLRAKEPVLVENGAVYIHNFHLPVWRKRMHHLATDDLRMALEACVTALESLDCPEASLLCLIFEALARTTLALETPDSSVKAEELCLRLTTALDRPGGTAQHSSAGTKSVGGKGAGNSKGKADTKKGDATAKTNTAAGATGARRASVSELKGLVEIRARSQAMRAGAGAVTAEGRPLLKALAFLSAASSLSGPPAAELVEKSVNLMCEYRHIMVAAVEATTASEQAAMTDGRDIAGNADVMARAPAHGGMTNESNRVPDKLDVFAVVSSRKGTTFEEDRAELDLVGEIWCRLGKDCLGRGAKRQAEECCGYVTELLPQTAADRRRVHPHLWRWLAVAEGLWGQAIAAMVSPASQEQPLQDELRRASMKHFAMAAKCSTLASADAVSLDIAKRFWNVALPLTETSAGRAISFLPLKGVLKEMVKGGVTQGGALRAQLYALLFECFSDRSEWKQGLAAVTESLQCVPPDSQRALWQWRVVFLSRLGVTALDSMAKAKDSDKVLQSKKWCTLARSSSDPNQQLSAYLKALECLGDRFERVDCLVEIGEWMMGRDLVRTGVDYLRSALDLLYDVEEKNVPEPDQGKDGDVGQPPSAISGLPTTTRSNGAGMSRSSAAKGGMVRSGTKSSLRSGRSDVGSRGSSGGQQSKGAPSTVEEPDENGYPRSLDAGHLETAVRILAVLARGGCNSFEERLDVLHQAYYFMGQMAAMVTETIAWSHRYDLYQEAVAASSVTANIAFEDWCLSSNSEDGGAAFCSPVQPHLRDWAFWRPDVEHGDVLCRSMASPPPCRERHVIASGVIGKGPLLFQHLLDVAEAMESDGLAAHAAVPLALSELVARLCLSPPRNVPTLPRRDIAEESDVQGGKSKGSKKVPVTTKGDAGLVDQGEKPARSEEGEPVPAVKLACLRRSRLNFKLGVTHFSAAIESAEAAGALGVSEEEAARRGAEADSIFRQREEASLSQIPQGSVEHIPSASVSTPTVDHVGRKSVHVEGDRSNGAGSRTSDIGRARSSKLEDRHMWALLSKEAAMLGEYRAASEYLVAAQRHNDAFHDHENVISCLESEAAVCEAQGYPERSLPCLLRASELLRRGAGIGASSARWGAVTVAAAGAMTTAGMGSAKVRQLLQTACDAMKGKIKQRLAAIEGQEVDGGDSASSYLIDIDAAVAYSRCMLLLANASREDDASSGSPGSPSQTTESSSATSLASSEHLRAPLTDMDSTAVKHIDQSIPRSSDAQNGMTADICSLPLRILTDAAITMRPLGSHPALAATLRCMAKEWVRRWSVRMRNDVEVPYRDPHTPPTNTDPQTPTAPTPQSKIGKSVATPPVRETGLLHCLESAATCLAEARSVLSAIIASAKPFEKMISSAAVIASSATESEAEEKRTNGLDADSNSAVRKGKKSKTRGDKVEHAGKVTEESPGCVPAGVNNLSTPEQPQPMATPLMRTFVMVHIEEACVRGLLGRLKGEHRSVLRMKEAAENDEDTTPVQKYLQWSKPVKHPTRADMALSQIDQALVLAGTATHLASSLSPEVTANGAEGTTNKLGTVGLLPLSLAWEGAALALTAARAGLLDGAWTRRPAPPAAPICQEVVDSVPAKSSKTKAKSTKAAIGKKGVKEESMPTSEDDLPVALPVFQENFDLREQAKWKLERAIRVGIDAKRWDAVGVAAFALGELLGGDDPMIAAGALMLHQSCRARGRLLRLCRDALPLPNRHRICLDRIAAAQGSLRGLHNLDTCDAHVVPSPGEASAVAEGQGGEGMTAGVEAFPPSEASAQFLSTNLEAWRRLECGHDPATALTVLPSGLAVLSLQVSPDGSTLYAAAYSAVDSHANSASTTDTDTPAITQNPPVEVWRHEMKQQERQALAALRSRNEAFRALVKRHCLDKCDEEGELGDVSSTARECAAVLSAEAVGTETNESTGSANASLALAPAECESELDAVIASMDAVLSPLWSSHGGLRSFLDRCRTDDLALVLLLDEHLERLPLEASSAFCGISRLARDFSLSMLHHRLKTAGATGEDVSNARMRYVADPCFEDKGFESRENSPPSPAVAQHTKRGRKAAAAVDHEDGTSRGGRMCMIKTLKECVGQGKGGEAIKGKGGTGKVNVSAWKGVGGDDHVPGVREWQSLVRGEPPRRVPGPGSGFLYYGPGRCLAKLAPKHLAGLNVYCKAIILVDLADNDASRRLESKQDTLKAQAEIELEGPGSTAAFFSLAGCLSVVSNMWPVTMHNNRRIVQSLFQRWGDEGVSLGEAVANVRGNQSIKARARYCTVLYGLPSLKYVQ